MQVMGSSIIKWVSVPCFLFSMGLMMGGLASPGVTDAVGDISSLIGGACKVGKEKKCPDVSNIKCSKATCKTKDAKGEEIAPVCEFGLIEKTAVNATALECTDVQPPNGVTDCAENGPMQVCATIRACATTCLQSNVDGKYYCQGPVGPDLATEGKKTPTGDEKCPLET